MKNRVIESDLSINSRFNEVYLKYLHKVRHFCFSYIPDKQICEDITQDVFETLWQRRENVKLDDSILTYILIIAKNKCLNILTKNNVHKKYSWRKNNRAKDELNAFALSELTVSKLYSNEISRIYSKALEQMSPQVRETYLKIRFDRMKYREVADMEKISIKTVEYRISAATAILRKFLRDYLRNIVIFVTGLVNI
ncbi:MAG: RNA polymerase sigma-70 factor [Bacteroidales bacterium]|nr:RNA polymerase sigma-70 factor [Bacteroidales bacterium]